MEISVRQSDKFTDLVLCATLLFVILLLTGCNGNKNEMEKIIFLHHSTGKQIWLGGTNKYAGKILKKSDVGNFFKKYNREHGTNYSVTEQYFPKETPYGWKNYPYDYYNIWVRNGGESPYMGEPTLEILTREYDVIIFKHCFPVSNILEDTGSPDINSEEKRLENYMLQYDALKEKMHQFPGTKFIVWTPAVHVQERLTADEAERTKAFRDWIINVWDERDDNIYVWDFYKYETEGGLYLKGEYSSGPGNSHPNSKFASEAALHFSSFIIDIIRPDR